MSVCGNVYTRPQSCDVIRIYPPQVHPFVPPPGGGGGWSKDVTRSKGRGVDPLRRPLLDDEEDVIIALALLDLL